VEDLNEIVIFAAVAQEGSFTAAATALGLQKSNVSRKVASLELRLNTRLLTRSTRALTLTEAGKVYFQHCQRVVEEVNSASTALAQMQTLPTGVLKISAPVVFGSEILTNLLKQFQQQHQQVDVNITVTDQPIDLLEKQIDVSFSAAPSTLAAYNSTPLGRAQRCVCASRDYLQQHGTPQTPEQLKEHNVIIFNSWIDSDNWSFRKSLVNKTVSLASRFETDDLSTVYRATLLGMGIAMLPLAIVSKEIQKGELIPLLTDWQLKPNQLYLSYHKDAYQTPKVRAFVDFIIESCRPNAPWSLSIDEL